jgi:hypothetical protein
MVEVVVLGARPEGNDIMQRPGEIYEFQSGSTNAHLRDWNSP